MSMSQNEALHFAHEFLGRMGSGAEPAEIAKLFSEDMEWEIADKPIESGNYGATNCRDRRRRVFRWI
jgi:hypothetical protein